MTRLPMHARVLAKLRRDLAHGEMVRLTTEEAKHVLARLERPAAGPASVLLACSGCGAVVRVSRQMADHGPHRCVACHGILSIS